MSAAVTTGSTATQNSPMVRTDIKTLFSKTFQDLQGPNSTVFQDSINSFSRTFKDTVQIAENKMAASLCKHTKGQRIVNNSMKVFLKSELTQDVTKCTQCFTMHFFSR